MFEVGLVFGLFAVGMLFSFILVCISVFIAKVFWEKFKRFASFEIKIQHRDYTEKIILEEIMYSKKRLKKLYALQKQKVN